MISYEDFAKLELRIGTIVEASDHPNADKLLVLKVNIGETVVQLVAGIRGFYQAADVVGVQVVVLTNLEPRLLRGVESQGMVLAASTADKTQLVVVTPQKEIAAGSIVK